MALLLLLLACADAEPPATPAQATAPAAPYAWIELKPTDGKLRSQLDHHCAAAAQAALRPFVELTAIWCAPCQALRKSLEDPLMIDARTGAYVVAVDVDLFSGELQEAGLVAYGVPTIFALGPDCRPNGDQITGAAWGEDTPASMAPPLKAFFQGQPG